MTSTLPATRIVVRRLPDLDIEPTAPDPDSRLAGLPRSPHTDAPLVQPEPTTLVQPEPTALARREPTATARPASGAMAGPAFAMTPARPGGSPPGEAESGVAPAARRVSPTMGEAGGARLHAHLVLRQVLEVLDGRRPAAQLTDLVSEPVLRYLTLAAGRLDAPRYAAARARRQSRARRASPAEQARGAGMRSMRICHPTDRVAEVSVVWRYRGRFRALAARFELPAEPGCTDAADEPPLSARQANARRGPRWRCTALRIG